MLWRVFGSTLALLAFAVVCLSGLVQGQDFAAVIRQSLLALAVGGGAGILLAVLVRYVVQEDFDRRFRQGTGQAAATGQPSGGAGGSKQPPGQDSPAGRQERVSQSAAGSRN
jgi:hypothetical protein